MKKTMRIELINEFHGTSAAVIAKRDNTGRYLVSARAYHRVIKKLCGQKDCQCGGVRGGKYNLAFVWAYYPADRYAVVVSRSCRL